MHCHYLQINDTAATSGDTPRRECLYRKNPWEKLIPPRACPDDGVCPYTEDGQPMEDHGAGCLH